VAEPFDTYVDQFQVVMSPWGAVLNFSVTAPKPPAPGQVPAALDVGSLRMSTEHLKALVFIARRQVLQVEKAAALSHPVAIEVLNQLGISPEDWDTFWR